MFYNTLLLCVIAEKRQMKKFYEKVVEKTTQIKAYAANKMSKLFS